MFGPCLPGEIVSVGGSKGAMCSRLVHLLVLHGDMGNIGNRLHLCVFVFLYTCACICVCTCASLFGCVPICGCVKCNTCSISCIPGR